MTSMKNKKILVIVESPNKCKKISEYLKNAGYTKAIVMASIGHISNLHDNRSSYKNTGIYPDQNFKLNILLSDDKKDVVKRLKEQADLAEYVYLMTDGDREGEAIAWSLIKFLKLKQDKYFRAITHEITPKAVIKAIENPIKLDDKLIEAAHSRMAIDKMVGYSLSPIARAYLGCKSVGRCQSAGLKLIVDREKEIQEFKPENYYNIYLNFEKNNTKFKAKYVGTDTEKVDKLKTKAEVDVVKYKCNSDYIVKSIITKEKKEAPKPPFCTATYQQEVANKIGLSVKDSMQLAQKLFEQGYITYHRSDSTEFAPEFITILKSYVEETFGNFTAPRVGKKSENDQNGHECIRVTDPTLTPELFAKSSSNALHLKIYTLIWQRTIASVLPDARIAETVYNIYNNDQKFNLVSNELIDPGYRTVYVFNDAQDEELVKETFKQDEILQKCSLEDVLKTTLPPARYTEASLVKELQARGIGRPSTFAGIVETVVSEIRGYAQVVAKKIIPTTRGIQLSNFLDRAFSNVINLSYTKEMEEDLDKISEGKLTSLDFLTAFYTNLEKTITENKETTTSVQIHSEQKVCPKCGAPTVIRRSRFGKLFYGCSNYPKCNGIINIE